jgi:excisionase family DNA binding protein
LSERYLTTNEFARIVGVSRSVVIKWIKSGRITAYSVHGGWRIPYSEAERLLKGVQRVRRVAIYARVSSNTQESYLERQVEYLKLWVSKNFPNAEYIIVTDIASGLNEDRRGVGKLIEIAKRKEIQAVVVAYRDRLTRFGFEYLKLVEDFVEIVTSFASRIYGKRSKGYGEVVNCIGNAIKDSN